MAQAWETMAWPAVMVSVVVVAGLRNRNKAQPPGQAIDSHCSQAGVVDVMISLTPSHSVYPYPL